MYIYIYIYIDRVINGFYVASGLYMTFLVDELMEAMLPFSVAQ